MENYVLLKSDCPVSGRFLSCYAPRIVALLHKQMLSTSCTCSLRKWLSPVIMIVLELVGVKRANACSSISPVQT